MLFVEMDLILALLIAITRVREELFSSALDQSYYLKLIVAAIQRVTN